MKNLLAFKNHQEENFANCPCREDIRDILFNFHINLLHHCSMPTAINADVETPEGGDKVPEEAETNSVTARLMALVWKTKEEENMAPEKPRNVRIGMFLK